MEARTTDKPLENNPFIIPLESGVIFLYLVQVTAICLSLLHVVLTPLHATVILLFSLTMAVIFFFKSRYPCRKIETPAGWLKILSLLFIVGVVLVYLVLWFIAIVSPDLSWDGNSYHIPAISMWASRGYIHWVTTPYLEEIINGYPKGAESIAYIVTLVFGNPVINGINLLFIPLGVLGVASLAASIGSRLWVALVTGFLVILLPPSINQSSTTYVDSAFTSSVIALLAASIHMLKQVRLDGRSSLSLGAAIGLSISVKSSGIALAALVGLLIFTTLIYHQIREYGHPHCKASNWYRSAWARLAGGFLLILLVSMGGGGFWYVRNLVRTGTPLYPVGVQVFDRQVFPGITVAEVIREENNTPQEFRDLSNITRILTTWFQGFTRWPASLRGYDNRFGGLGFLWLVGCLPAITLFLIIQIWRSALPNSGFLPLLILVSIVFLITPMNWWARYVSWLYALGLPAFAWMVDQVLFVFSPNRFLTKLGKVWLGLCLFLAVFEGLYCTRDVIAVATPGSSISPITLLKPVTWKWSSCYLFPDMCGTPMEEVLLDTHNVAIGPFGEGDFWRYAGLVGQLSQPIGTRSVIFLTEDGHMTSQADGEIRFFLWDSSLPLPRSLSAYPFKVAGQYYIFSLLE